MNKQVLSVFLLGKKYDCTFSTAASQRRILSEGKSGHIVNMNRYWTPGWSNPGQQPARHSSAADYERR